MKLIVDIPEETYKTISEWKEPNPKYAAEYMLYGFVKNGIPLDDVLNKIIEEIEHLHDWAFSRDEILRIIDKYKGEMSGEK